MEQNTFSEIDTLVELFILLLCASFSIFATGWAVKKFTEFNTSYLERDKVMIRYVDIEEVDPYRNLTAYEAYMINWIATDSIDQEIATVADDPGNSRVILSTRENGKPRPNYSVYKARVVTGYAGMSPNVKDIIKKAPGGSSTAAIQNKYRGIGFRFSLDLTNAYVSHPSSVTNWAGQLLENKETYVWTLIPRTVP